MHSVKEKIIRLREAIRYARDQQGDSRCWIDYWVGYRLLSDTNQHILVLPAEERGMRICTSFYRKRKAQESSIPRKLIPETEWNKDLENKSEPVLQITLEELETAWRTHRDTPIEELTLSHDRTLYRLLPEHGHVPVDFTLPPRNEFLGTTKDGAGCPNFWKSHSNCKSENHNPHEWGPCEV